MTYNELKTEFLRRVNLLKLTDMAALNHKCAEILGKIVSENVFEIDDISESCKKILREYCELMNKTNARLQKKLDEKIGLQIAAQKADFPAERVAQIAKSLTDPTVPPETIQRRARVAVENIAKSFHDDYVRENAKFRSKAGIKCYIVRESSGDCCEWCSSLAGRYVCGEEPDDVYHRHNNCPCTTTFENGRERQDVYSKKKWKVTPVLKIPYEPLVFDKNQAQSLQNIQLAKYKNSGNGLTSVSNSGKIESNRSLINIDSGFIPVSDIESAENFAKNTLGIPNVSYKGVDIVTANEWNRGLAEAFSKFPELKKKFGFVGTCQERNRLLEIEVRKYYEKQRSYAKGKISEDTFNFFIEDDVTKYMKLFNILANENAQSFSEINISKYPEFPEFYGISVSDKFGNNSENFISILKKEVKLRHRPVGCDTIKSVLDHEIGHQLDNLLGIRNNSDITSIFDYTTSEELKDMLSGYAVNNSNRNKYAEMIAEAWAEYCNNPEPRPIAKYIGDIIIQEYKRKFG
ncbi:MAG: hypothetical protein K2O60_06575 [Ruminococcus sp.]|nr:hypothetical protein [Ruminococcus sp.]